MSHSLDNQASQLTGFDYGNGVSAAYGYSAQRMQLSSVAYSNGGTLFSLSYGYSQSGANNGQIAGITDNVDSGRTASYTYDARRRLAAASTSGSAGYAAWGLSWTYDDYGNRTAQSVTAGSGPSNSVSVSTSTNRITGMGGYTFYYDSSGNLTQDDLYKYKYDAEHRLVETRDLSNNLIGTYAYDGNSLRTIKVWGADRTWYLYSGTELISEYEDAASASYSNPTYPGGGGSDSTSALLYQHADHLTTRMTTDQQGQVSNEQAHYPYGEQWYAAGQGDSSVDRKFTSYMKDWELATGKMNNAGRREHSGRTGRFIRPARGSRDPQGLNGYAYTGSDAPPQLGPCGEAPCVSPTPSEVALGHTTLQSLAASTPGQLGLIYGWMASMMSSPGPFSGFGGIGTLPYGGGINPGVLALQTGPMGPFPVSNIRLTCDWPETMWPGEVRCSSWLKEQDLVNFRCTYAFSCNAILGKLNAIGTVSMQFYKIGNACNKEIPKRCPSGSSEVQVFAYWPAFVGGGTFRVNFQSSSW